MSTARHKHDVLDQMTRTEMEKVLYEANLGKVNEKIARLYFIEKLPQLDIGMELMLDRKTVGVRLKEIEEKMLRAAMHICSP